VRLFLDSNILFSACRPDSFINSLFTASRKLWSLVTSNYAVTEARRNLLRKSLECAGNLEAITGSLTLYDTQTDLPAIPLPECDRPIIRSAVAASSTHLWTGDKKHFGLWYDKSLYGVKIISSTLLTRMLYESGWRG